MPVYYKVMKPDYYEMAIKFRVNPKHCDNPEHYEKYLTQSSLSDMKTGNGTTFVFINENDEVKDIIGFVTMKASSLIMDDGKNKIGNPALEISELAVSEKYERKGIGTDIVQVVIGLANELNETCVGIKYIVLCADPKAVGFYENSKLGFSKISNYYEVPRETSNIHCISMFLRMNYYK